MVEEEAYVAVIELAVPKCELHLGNLRPIHWGVGCNKQIIEQENSTDCDDVTGICVSVCVQACAGVSYEPRVISFFFGLQIGVGSGRNWGCEFGA